MPFPTTNLIDDFNRANQLPPSANWSLLTGVNVQMKVLNNTCVPDANNASDYWNVGTFGPDSEVFATISSLPDAGKRLRLLLRIQQPGSAAFDGYAVEIYRPTTGSHEVFIKRWDNQAETTLLGPLNQNFAVGDRFGLQAEGTTLRAWIEVGAGWTMLGSTTDTTYQSAGYIGIIAQTGSGIDDFSGGNLAQLGVVSLSGSGGIASIGVRGRNGIAALAANGGSAVIAEKGLLGVAAISGAGGSAIIGERGQSGAAALAGTGNVICVGRGVFAGKLQAAGSSIMTVTVNAIKNGAAALAGVSQATIAAIRAVNGKAILSALATSSVLGTRGMNGASALNGAGGATVNGSAGRNGTAAMSSSGSLSGLGVRGQSGASALAGSGLWTVKGSGIFAGQASLNGVASMIINILQGEILGQAILSGISGAAISGIRGVSGMATLPGEFTLFLNTFRVRQMNEFIDSLVLILSNATAPGGELAGFKVITSEHEGVQDDTILVTRDRETAIQQNGPMKYALERALITVYKAVDKSVAGTKWRDGEDAAEINGRKVEKVIGLNPALKTATYPNGLTKAPQETQIEEKTYGTKAIGKSGWFSGVTMTLRVKLLYRNGVVSLN